MFLSMNWVRDFVDLDGLNLEELIHQFTLSTAEVEGIEYIGKDIRDVVVGQILSVEPHPESKKLHLLEVDGGDRVYHVVCGAHSTPRLRRRKAAQAVEQATKQALTAAALS